MTIEEAVKYCDDKDNFSTLIDPIQLKEWLIELIKLREINPDEPGRVIYFGTAGQAGHEPRPIIGRFSRDEEKEIMQIDGDKSNYLLKWNKFNYFKWIDKYSCIGFPASPDDHRGGCKTVVFVEGNVTREKIIGIINDNNFLKTQFGKLEKMYNTKL
jgi:hypothetical protein